MKALLHHVPGVFQGNYFPEEDMPFIQCTKEFFIFPGAKTKTDIGRNTKFNLNPDAFNNEIKLLLQVLIFMLFESFRSIS